MQKTTHHHHIARVFANALAVAALGCSGANVAETQATVRVFKYAGSVQCTGGGADLSAMTRQLRDAGLQVISSACGTDGRMRVAMCGASDGRVGIFELSSKDAQLAAKLGFNLLSELPEAKTVPCK